MEIPDIEWREPTTAYTAGERGYLGGICLWSVFWGSTTDKANPYELRCELPGMRRSVRVSTVTSGKKRAAKQLAFWLDKIGITSAS